jgi:hypothetical protein
MSYRIYEYETYSKIVYENELNDCRIILQVYPKNVVLDSYLLLINFQEVIKN